MSAGRELALHSVTGVYELTKAGLAPLRPAHLPGTGPSYEVEDVPGVNGPSPQLVLRMPEAFTTPRKLVVEALWHQPRFAAEAWAASASRCRAASSRGWTGGWWARSSRTGTVRCTMI